MKKTLEDFRNDVIKELGVEYMFSYCPLCYGVDAILNNHRCQEGWELWFNGKNSYTKKVTHCVQWMKISNRKV
jgi:hypothetical protein